MSIPGSANPLLLASAAEAGAYQIERSVRCNSADSAYLSRTAGSPTASGTWTFSVWVKRSKLGSDTAIFGGRSGGVATQVYFKSDNTIRWYENTADFSTTAVFRDVSSWYHFVFAKNGSSSCTIYVNGVQLQQNTSSVPSTSPFNTSSAEMFLGAIGILPSGAGFYGDHYLADIHFIDGQALTPSSFTEVSATTGQLIPKAYTGSYGTNGFHLPFSDNSTAAALGTDTSGNGNNWTPNNFSVTAGAGNDSLVDTPTSYGTDTGAGGEVRGNYATWNPLRKAGSHTLSNGNLDIVMGSDSGSRTTFATIGVSSGKWYWETTITNATNVYYPGVGVNTNLALSPEAQSGDTASGFMYLMNGQKFSNGTLSSYGASFSNGDVIGIALDMDAGTITFYKNGSTQGQAFSGITGTATPCVIGFGPGATPALTVNYGARSFAYTAPSGFKALCDTNLTSTTITTSGSYTGNGVADGPFVYLNGVPTAMTIGGNAVTFGTHADKLANGFKIRTSSTTYNQNASSYNYSITSTDAAFKNARAQPNP